MLTASQARVYTLENYKYSLREELTRIERTIERVAKTDKIFSVGYYFIENINFDELAAIRAILTEQGYKITDASVRQIDISWRDKIWCD